MAAALSTYTVALLLALLALCAVGQQQQQEADEEEERPTVEPRCSRPFTPPAPSCFCSRFGDNDWSVACSCPEDSFPAGQEVVLTPQLLPPTDDPADRLVISVLGCRRSVRLSAPLLSAADVQFSSITLEVRDTDQLLLPEPAAAQPMRYNSITARLQRVSLPRVTGALFAQRLSTRVGFSDVEIGEITSGAFRQQSGLSEVVVVDSRVGRIAEGAFSLPVGVESDQTTLTGLQIVRSHVAEWASGGHVGGVLVHVIDSSVGRLRTGALSTAGLVELHWNHTTVAEVEPRAVHDGREPPPDVLPAAILGFYSNTFEAVTAGNDTDTDTSGPLHFSRGVPGALEFLDNDVWGAAVAPVTPAPWPEQVAGTRVECECPLLRPWLPDAEAFLAKTLCRPSSPGDQRLRRAAVFYRAECADGERLAGELDDDEVTRRAPPISSGARVAAAIAQLAAGLYSTLGSRTLAGGT